MSFGGHKGQHVAEVPGDYLVWYLTECQYLNTGLRHAIEQELERRSTQARTNGQSYAGGTLADLPGIIRMWYRELVLVHHPDRGGSHEAMVAINNAHERLKELTGVR
jgi:uncharacterized protein (DUF3820 family)